VVAPAIAAPPRQGSGPAALAGIGYQAGGGAGLELVYYQRLGQSPVSLAPHAGAGVSGFEAQERSALGWCAGLLFVYGYRHRVVLAADYGVLRHEGLQLHGSLVTWKAVLGPQLGAGYEWVRANGFVLQVIPALAYPTEGLIPSWRRKLEFGLSVNLGWKAW
jgi:hypothetical protein